MVFYPSWTQGHNDEPKPGDTSLLLSSYIVRCVIRPLLDNMFDHTNSEKQEWGKEQGSRGEESLMKVILEVTG